MPGSTPSLLLALGALLLAGCSLSLSGDGDDAPSRRRSTPPGPAVEQPPLRVGEHVFLRRTLGNGLQLLAARDPDADDASVYVVYGVGSRMEGPLTTGLAHLVEHAMYAGSRKVPAGEHDRRVKELGAESNAFTRLDHTAYFDHGFPPEALEQVLELEADRMAGLTWGEAAFLHERHRLEVEEAGTHTEDDGREELVESAVFRTSSQGAGVLDGERHSQAPRLTLQQARHFHETWYHPDRAALVVAGAIDPLAALDLAERIFARLPAGPATPPPAPPEPATARGGEARFASSLTRERVEACWVGPALVEPEGGSRERQALDVLAAALAERRAPDGSPVEASMGGGVERDLFRLVATGEQADEVLDALLDELLAGGPGDDELLRARDAAREALARRTLQTGRPYFTLAVAVAIYAALGHPDYPARYAEEVGALSPDEVRQVTRRWLVPERRWTVRFLADADAGQDLPDDTKALYQAALDATGSGDVPRAIAAYEKLMEQGPDRMNTVIFLYSLGELRRSTGDLEGWSDL